MTRTQERVAQIVGVLLLTGGLALWLTSTFKDNILFFVTPSELIALHETDPIKAGKKFRLGGLVKKDSVIKNGLDIKFTIIDENLNSQAIHFHGIPPELFKENQGVVAEGAFRNNVFEAERLLAKHDERYTPRQLKHKKD